MSVATISTAFFETPLRYKTVAEYLDFERNSDTKHEYENGTIIPMSGAKPNHNRISMNISVALVALFAYQNHEVFGSDQRVRVDNDGPFYYPDVVVSDGEGVFDEEYCLRNPLVIVKVLSDSTQHRDSTTKFRNYRRIISLRHYILIAQDEIHIEHWQKDAVGQWFLAGDFDSRDAIVTFLGVEGSVTVEEIYRRVAV